MMSLDLSKRTILLIITLTIFLPVIVFASSKIIHIKATDHQSGISKILLPNGEIIDGDEIEYTVYENGLYEFIAYDHAGNIAQEFYIQISDISQDKEVESVIEEVEEELENLEGEEKE